METIAEENNYLMCQGGIQSVCGRLNILLCPYNMYFFTPCVSMSIWTERQNGVTVNRKLANVRNV